MHGAFCCGLGKFPNAPWFLLSLAGESGCRPQESECALDEGQSQLSAEGRQPGKFARREHEEADAEQRSA